ncbi:MAG: HPr family phosphocarrier protein [Roseiflexaceae bacterium]|nr:HPr family phosphocarrier protein [Roseiflexaceae bacterium]
MREATITLDNKDGLHARPAALFVQTARQFTSIVTVENHGRPEKKPIKVSAFNLLQIGAKSGHSITIRAEGADEEAALAALVKLIEDKFGE